MSGFHRMTPDDELCNSYVQTEQLWVTVVSL